MNELELYKKVNEVVDTYFNLGVNKKDVINYFNKGNTTIKTIAKRLNDKNITESIIADVLRDRVAEYIDTNN